MAPSYHGFGLHWLDLSGNRLQDSGAAAVVRALVNNETVLALDLSANAIGRVWTMLWRVSCCGVVCCVVLCCVLLCCVGMILWQ